MPSVPGSETTPPSRRSPVRRRSRIVLLVAYCLVLYASAAYLYPLARWAQGAGHGWIAPGLTLAFVGLTGVAVATQVVRALSRKRTSHLLFLGVALVSFFPAYFNIERPLERFHFLEYSVLGALLFWVLAPQRYSLRFYLTSLNILLLISYGDEVIQGFVAGRFYDIHDIWINIFKLF